MVTFLYSKSFDSLVYCIGISILIICLLKCTGLFKKAHVAFDQGSGGGGG